MTSPNLAYFDGRTQISVTVGLFFWAGQFFQWRILRLPTWKVAASLIPIRVEKCLWGPRAQAGDSHSIVLTSTCAFLPHLLGLVTWNLGLSGLSLQRVSFLSPTRVSGRKKEGFLLSLCPLCHLLPNLLRRRCSSQPRWP